MAKKALPPYTSSTGLFKSLLEKIKEAPPPTRFSGDFLFNTLKFKKSGSTIPFIPMLKRLGLLSNDGTPTDLYKQFRSPNEKTAGAAMAEAIRTGYADLYIRKEDWHNLEGKDLKDFLIEVLEMEPKNVILKFMGTTINVLKEHANFEVKHEPLQDQEEKPKKQKSTEGEPVPNAPAGMDKINLSYTINLNLPETTDEKVFAAIFSALKEHLLDNE